MSVYDIHGNDLINNTVIDSYPKVTWDTVIHRGWGDAPVENTLPAFYEAKINGYNWVECDVRLSSDNVWVVWHNTTITDVNDDIYTIANETAQTLTSLILANDNAYGDIHVCTLEQMLKKAGLLNLGVVIDIKAGSTQAVFEDLAKIVLSTGMQNKVIYMPSNTTTAGYIQAIDKHASFDFIASYTSVSDLPELTAYQALLTDANTVAFDLNSVKTDADGGIDTTLISTIRASGLNVSFWNIRNTAYSTYMDLRPLRITKNNSADSTNLDALYLRNQTLY